MAHAGQLDFRQFVDKRVQDRVGGEGHDGREYAYISDKNTRLAFAKMKAVELAATAAVRTFKSTARHQLLGNAVKVGPRQISRIYSLAEQCARSLDVPTPQVYVKNSPVMNAMTYGTNDDSFIILHSALIDQFSDEELLTVIGHETGHIHNSHVIYLTAVAVLTAQARGVAQMLLTPVHLAMSGWMRRAEITCDRAGLLCGKNLKASLASFAKLAVGSQKLFDELDVDVFIEQHEEHKNDVGKFTELPDSHPYLTKRMVALKTFSESKLYRMKAGLGTDGLTMEQVDEKVHEIIKIWG